MIATSKIIRIIIIIIIITIIIIIESLGKLFHGL